MTTAFYVLECMADGCVAEFYLNDVPVVGRGPDLGKQYAGQSNQYLVDGLNEISILVNPGPTPSKAIHGPGGRRIRAAAPGAKASASLCRYPFGATVGGPSREELARAEWFGPAGDAPVVFPLVVTARKDLGKLAGRWEWESSERIALDAESRAGIGMLLSELRTSLDAGDPEPFIEAGRTRLAELALAYGQPPGKKERIIRKAMDDDSSQPWWGMQDLDPKQFDFRLCGRNRLVEALNADWNPCLREKPDPSSGVGLYGMMIGRSGGRWKILR